MKQGRTTEFLEQRSSLNPPSHLLALYLLFSQPLCTLVHFQISISQTLKRGQTNSLNPHLNKYMQGWVGSELSRDGDERGGWCGAVCWHTVVGNSEYRFFSGQRQTSGGLRTWSEASSGLSATPRLGEKRRLPVASLRRGGERRQAGTRAGRLDGWGRRGI